MTAATCARLHCSGVQPAAGESGYTSLVVANGALVTLLHRKSWRLGTLPQAQAQARHGHRHQRKLQAPSVLFLFVGTNKRSWEA